MKRIQGVVLGQGVLLGMLLTSCELLEDEAGWGRQRSGEFQDCTCSYEVTGALTRSEDGRLDIWELSNGGRRNPYYGGDGSLLFECAAGPDDDDARGVSIVIDDFRGPGAYALAADTSLDPSTFAYRPSNLGGATFRPAEGADCVLDVFEERAGRFTCRDLEGPDGNTATVRGRFDCGR